MQNTIAIICDCDETLASDTTSLLLQRNGIDVKQFWNEIEKYVENGWDPPIAWMNKIVKLIQEGEIKQNTNQKLREFGKEVKPYPGVLDFITNLKESIKSVDNLKGLGISLEAYIISSGIQDIISGSSLNDSFDDIFAASFSENSSGLINGIKSSVTFTEKTKFLYAINKGITGDNLRKSPYKVNDAVSLNDRRIPFENMIYLGDGPSDIPCFSTIKNLNGNCIGIVGNDSAYKGYHLARGKRTTVGPYSKNYTKDSDLYLILETIVKKLSDDMVSNAK